MANEIAALLEHGILEDLLCDFLGRDTEADPLGFFADDEWVADVSCPDCEKSLTKSFQGASFSPFQPAATPAAG